MQRDAIAPARKHSLPLFILSVIASLGLWVLVQVNSSTSRAYTFQVVERNLPENLVITSALPRITLEATGTKEELDTVDQKFNLRELLAYVDLSRATPVENPNRLFIRLDLKGIPAAVRWTNRTPSIDVEVQPRIKEVRPVVVETMGSPDEGYSVADTRADPQTVNLYGLRSDVDRVVRVQALLNLSEAKRGEPTAVTLRLLDENNTELIDTVVVDPSSVLVRATYVPAAPKRYLPILPTWSGQLPTGFVFSQNHALNPSQLQVTGETQALSRLTALETEPINLTELKQTRTFRVKLKVPRGIRLLGGNTVNVTVFVAPVATPPVANPGTPPTTTGNQPP